MKELPQNSKHYCIYYPEECFYFNQGDLKGHVNQLLTIKNNQNHVT